MDGRYDKIISGLEAICAKREYCSRDILQKAASRLDGDVDAAREILSRLVSEGYVDDLRYASAFAREKSALTGWGPAKIRFALSAKHIPSGIIDEAMGEVDTDRAELRLRKIMEGKWKSLSGLPDAKLRLLRFALSRGYGYDQVKSIADELSSQ